MERLVMSKGEGKKRKGSARASYHRRWESRKAKQVPGMAYTEDIWSGTYLFECIFGPIGGF